MVEADLSGEVIDPLSPVVAFRNRRLPGSGFAPEVIVVAVRWYLRFNLSLSRC
jgi:hypothetical protein